MISAALILTQAAASPIIIERPDPSFDGALVQAVVKPSFAFGTREAAAWQVLTRMLNEGGSDLSFSSFFEYGSQTGITPRIHVFADMVRFQMAAPSDGIPVMAQLLGSLMRRARLPEASFAKHLAAAKGQRRDPWEEMIQGQSLDYTALRYEHVYDLYRQVFRPENTWIVVQGKFAEGAGKQALGGIYFGVEPAPSRRSLRFDPLPTPPARHRSEVTTMELRSQPITVSQHAKILATLAFGGGKEASLFRVVRESMRLSYRQDMILWPTAQGWTPRVLISRVSQSDDKDLAAKVKDALLKDVAAWTEETRLRALATAESSFTRSGPYQPIWLAPEGPMGRRDEAAFLAYQAATGQAMLTQDQVLLSLGAVKLEDLKAAAAAMIETAAPILIPGS